MINTCERADYDPTGSYQWISNTLFTGEEMKNCPYYIGEDNGKE